MRKKIKRFLGFAAIAWLLTGIPYAFAQQSQQTVKETIRTSNTPTLTKQFKESRRLLRKEKWSATKQMKIGNQMRTVINVSDAKLKSLGNHAQIDIEQLKRTKNIRILDQK